MRDYGVEVDWRPFELHPELPPEGGSLGYNPERTKVFRGRIREMAVEGGLEMNFRDKVSNSRLALEATEFVREHAPDKFDAFHRGVMDAYWRDSKNIGEVAVLVDVAKKAGLDPQALREALADRRYAQAVEAQIDFARQAGLDAVPAFIFDDKYLVQGAQPYEVFERVMQQHVLPGRQAEG